MVRSGDALLGLCPERFNSIETPPILTNPEHAMPNDGLPAFAQLDVLIAYLTAATTVNDDVMTDFLMTFRHFASEHEVWRLLASRLLWAADMAARTGSESEQGKDVGTRCFVIMRQWVRDYFEMDFLPSVKLRQIVAETVTALSGCTEFVLLDHFHRILEQFRAVWDGKIEQYWTIPPGISRNVDAPVPTGGDPPVSTANSASNITSAFASRQKSTNHPTISHLLAGEIPIDADIAVTSIHSSPDRRHKLKPRPKISMLFNRALRRPASMANLNASSKHSAAVARSGDNYKINEGDVLLQDRVDLLAMQIIDEYHNRERLYWIPKSDACSIAEPETAAVTEALTVPAQQDVRRLPHAASTDLFSQIGGGKNLSNEELSRQMSTDLMLQISSSKLDLALRPAPSSPRRFSSTTDESQTSERPDLEEPVSLSKSRAIQAAQRMSGASGHSQISGHVEESTRRESRSGSLSTMGSIEVVDDEVSIQELRDYDSEPRASFDNAIATRAETPGYPDSRCVTPEVQPVDNPAFGDDNEDTWATPSRSFENTPTSQWNLSRQSVTNRTENPLPITHEKSADTLNMNNMGLANISGESEPDLEPENESQFNSTSRRGPVHSFDVLDFNDFETYDNHSYCGSSLSTLSTSTTKSRFSYHQDQQYVENRSFNALRTMHGTVDLRKHTSGDGYYSPLSAPATTPSTNTDSPDDLHRRSDNSSISLISEVDNSKMVPCAGYTESDAAILKAMPDEDVSGDALLITLQKLEGNLTSSQPKQDGEPDQVLDSHVRNMDSKEIQDQSGAEQHSHAKAVHATGQNFASIPRSSTIELYNQALETSEKVRTPERKVADRRAREMQLDNEISQLGIALNEVPTTRNALLLGKEYEAYHNSPKTDPNAGINRSVGSNNLCAVNGMTTRYPGFSSNPNATQSQPLGLASPFQSRNCTGATTADAQPDVPKPLPTLYIGLPGASHAPFVLAYSARAVAEQMTLIEREVVCNLDWNALLRMEWPRRTEPTKSWLQVMMDEPIPQGTALVQARFDLVYSWVQSEVLLCPNPGLQAQAISRFIQIAFESLRLQNFATMVQLVLALCSPEVQTQLNPLVSQLLPLHDKENLERLEFLSSPHQNYSKLRHAHNRYAWNKGCIPFTRMFLQDIELTAEANSFNAEHEVHFGKYRVCAHLVKALHRCADSAANYKFALDPALFSKCLYLSSLPEFNN